MKQLIQNFKTGKLYIEDVPVPALNNGFVLVKNIYSLISAGTERSTVSVGQSSLVGKVKKRPDLVKQVIQNIKKDGLISTYHKVKTKLNSPKSLGYSSAGIVLESRDWNGKFKKGERVACGSGYACHAEFISVPQNLTVKVPNNVSFQEAAFTTLGAIALQGIRQADPKIGDKICIIGLGLIGQLTSQILKANGCSVFGVDISEFTVKLARKMGIDFAISRDHKDLYKFIDEFTNGYGFDVVIITASAKDNDPIVLATEVLRKKGRIIVVGAVRMDIPREPDFYQKELELKISTSYGPGRYDPVYEEVGMDYPYGYVRYSENRNMETFLELVSKGKMNIKPLITHVFDINAALEAYDLILGIKKENFLGVLLKYDKSAELQRDYRTVVIKKNISADINVGFIGAGSFAQNYLIPHLKQEKINLKTVVTSRGITAKQVAKKFGFSIASTDPNLIWNDNSINLIFIATPHNTHTKYVVEALKREKDVFVEKPLALNLEELKEIVEVYRKHKAVLMIGFNRRFATICRIIKEELKENKIPLILNYRINAGFISREHWIQDNEIGGGRIIGEVCHFIDLMQYFTGAFPKLVYAQSIDFENVKWKDDDNVAINIKFTDGSIGNIIYTAMGDKKMSKEYLEIFSGGDSYVINDFKKGIIYKNKKVIKNKGKGHKEEISEFINNLRTGKGNMISFDSILATTLTTFLIMESLKDKKVKEVNLDII